jgi:hypothetical protein
MFVFEILGLFQEFPRLFPVLFKVKLFRAVFRCTPVLKLPHMDVCMLVQCLLLYKNLRSNISSSSNESEPINQKQSSKASSDAPNFIKREKK